MRRYAGPSELSPSPRVALISNDAIGNYVVITPMLRMLRERLKPATLDYFGGKRTEELWRADEKIDFGFALHGSEPREAARVAAERGPYDLVINVEQSAWAKCFAAILCGKTTRVCGPCMGSEGRGDLPFGDDERARLWLDKEWIAPDLTQRHPFLRSGFIAEIFARLAYLDGELLGYDVPREAPWSALAASDASGASGERKIPPLLISASASLAEKLWPREKWEEAIKKLGMEAGLIGAKSGVKSSSWMGGSAEDELVSRGLVRDLRGLFTLPQVVGALGEAKLVLSLDNGVMHLASAAGAPTVGLFREGIHRLWMPRGVRGVWGEKTGAGVGEIAAGEVVRICGEVMGGRCGGEI